MVLVIEYSYYPRAEASQFRVKSKKGTKPSHSVRPHYKMLSSVNWSEPTGSLLSRVKRPIPWKMEDWEKEKRREVAVQRGE